MVLGTQFVHNFNSSGMVLIFLEMSSCYKIVTEDENEMTKLTIRTGDTQQLRWDNCISLEQIVNRTPLEIFKNINEIGITYIVRVLID